MNVNSVNPSLSNQSQFYTNQAAEPIAAEPIAAEPINEQQNISEYRFEQLCIKIEAMITRLTPKPEEQAKIYKKLSERNAILSEQKYLDINSKNPKKPKEWDWEPLEQVFQLFPDFDSAIGNVLDITEKIDHELSDDTSCCNKFEIFVIEAERLGIIFPCDREDMKRTSDIWQQSKIRGKSIIPVIKSCIEKGIFKKEFIDELTKIKSDQH